MTQLSALLSACLSVWPVCPPRKDNRPGPALDPTRQQVNSYQRLKPEPGPNANLAALDLGNLEVSNLNGYCLGHRPLSACLVCRVSRG
jgi:hypothetical protein